MKKLIRFGLVVLTLSLTVMACGNRENSNETSGSDTTAADHTLTDTTALDTLNTDTLGTVGNDSVQ